MENNEVILFIEDKITSAENELGAAYTACIKLENALEILSALRDEMHVKFPGQSPTGNAKKITDKAASNTNMAKVLQFIKDRKEPCSPVQIEEGTQLPLRNIIGIYLHNLIKKEQVRLLANNLYEATGTE